MTERDTSTTSLWTGAPPRHHATAPPRHRATTTDDADRAVAAMPRAWRIVHQSG